MAINHTIGPWTTGQAKKQEDFENQTYFSIMSVNPVRKDNKYVMPGFYYPHSLQSPEEMEANAKLIASAPEQLKENMDNTMLLIQIADTLDGWISQLKLIGWQTPQMEQQKNLADKIRRQIAQQSAIKKATK